MCVCVCMYIYMQNMPELVLLGKPNLCLIAGLCVYWAWTSSWEYSAGETLDIDVSRWKAKPGQHPRGPASRPPTIYPPLWVFFTHERNLCFSSLFINHSGIILKPAVSPPGRAVALPLVFSKVFKEIFSPINRRPETWLDSAGRSSFTIS